MSQNTSDTHPTPYRLAETLREGDRISQDAKHIYVVTRAPGDGYLVVQEAPRTLLISELPHWYAKTPDSPQWEPIVLEPPAGKEPK